MIYTGIGSRKTPLHIQYFMTIFAACMNGTLRSGGANGADLAFEIGASEKEIYLPSLGFNGNKSTLVVTEFDNFKEIEEVAKAIHPSWSACNEYAKFLHTRNVCQVLGKDLDSPSDLVICWTPDGANNRHTTPSRQTGGTGTAITLAGKFDIPVLNLYNQSDIQNAYDMVSHNNFIQMMTDLSDTVNAHVLDDVIRLMESLNL